MMTPSAASETVSSPPCTGYIQSQKPLGEGGRGGGGGDRSKREEGLKSKIRRSKIEGTQI